MRERDRRHSRFRWVIRTQYALFLAAGVAITSAEALCQSTTQSPSYRMLESTNASLVRLLEEAQLFERPEQVPLQALYARTITLQRLLAPRGGAMPVEFKETLDANEELLRRFSWSSPPDDNIALLEDVAWDIRVKTQYLDAPKMGAFPIQRSLLVLVKVRTLRRGAPVPGFIVGFNPLRDKEKSEFRYPVSSTTDNAQRLLPPGVYAMRVSQGRTSVPRTIEVGEAGQENQTIDVEL